MTQRSSWLLIGFVHKVDSTRESVARLNWKFVNVPWRTTALTHIKVWTSVNVGGIKFCMNLMSFYCLCKWIVLDGDVINIFWFMADSARWNWVNLVGFLVHSQTSGWAIWRIIISSHQSILFAFRSTFLFFFVVGALFKFSVAKTFESGKVKLIIIHWVSHQ